MCGLFHIAEQKITIKNNRERKEERTKHRFKDSKAYEDEVSSIFCILHACILCVAIAGTQRKSYTAAKNAVSSLVIVFSARRLVSTWPSPSLTPCSLLIDRDPFLRQVLDLTVQTCVLFLTVTFSILDSTDQCLCHALFLVSYLHTDSHGHNFLCGFRVKIDKRKPSRQSDTDSKILKLILMATHTTHTHIYMDSVLSLLVQNWASALSRIGEKDFFPLKRAVKNSWTAKFTGCY